MNQEDVSQVTQENNTCEKLQQVPCSYGCACNQPDQIGFVGLDELREELKQVATLGHTNTFTQLDHTKESPKIKINFNAPVTINIIKS